MKRAVRLVFIVQLIVLTILGAVIYFQNSYVRLFYKDISYIDVLVSDDKAFNAFLSWTEERGIIVSRISINPDNEITLHVSDWALSDNLILLEGSSPEQGEFVSDIITHEMNQSGLMKRLLPNYNFKIYSLYEPEHYNFTSLYAITTTSEYEINEMKEELALEGVTIYPNELYNSNSLFLLLSSFSRIHIILVGIFLCVSILVMLVLLTQFVIQQNKTINIYLTLGYSRLRIIYSIISDLFFGKIWIGWVGGLYIIISVALFCIEEYKPFYVQIVSLYLVLAILISCIYATFLSCELLVCLIKRRNGFSLVLKNMKPNMVVQVANYFVKFVSVFLFFVSITFLAALYEKFATDKHNMQSWIDIKDIYKVSMSDVGQDYDLSIEVELHKKITDLYQHLITENNAFFMDADDIYAMEVYGVDYPLTGLVTNGYSTHITVSPNYFQFNPIFTSEGIPIEQELVYADNVLNILVPESLSSIYDELNKQFLNYFEFYRYRIYENVYSDASNDSWNPSRQKDLEVNIIPVKTGQLYFTLSPDIRQNDNNKVLDPVVVVYTDNFHPSSTFTKTSRCLYFEYDDNHKKTPNDYLAEIVDMDDFVFASSVWKDVSDRVTQLRRNYAVTILLTIFIILGYFVTSFSLFSNYFMRNRYAVTIKTLWGYSIYRRYCSAFVILFTPTLLAILLFLFAVTSKLSRLFPTISLQETILVGMFVVGIDIAYFVIIEKILSKKSMNSILKGDVS